MEKALRDLVMYAMADDYESFEIISGFVREHSPAASDADIQQSLMEAIADGLAEAYELGQSSRKVDFDVAKLQEHWYYLSPRGIEYVKAHPYRG